MAVKLYPPMIEGTLPAFCGTELSVPFSMNRAVGTLQIAGFILKLKTVSGNFLGTFQNITQDGDVDSALTINHIIEEGEVTFDLSAIENKIEIGQYYKAQLAYIGVDGTIGYYSTVGVVKFTTKPKVSIGGFTFGKINPHTYSYLGVYSQENGDSSEKMYSYRFVIYDENNNIFADSLEHLHTISRDESPNRSVEEFFLTRDLELGKSYYIKFFVTTTNGMKIASPKYRVVQRQSIKPEIHAELKADIDYDEGAIKLTLKDEIDKVVSGLFLVARASSKNGYVWEEFRRFNLQSLPPEKWSISDYTVEQGVTYRYSIQQYNLNKVYSDRIISNAVYCDFEDAFLYDGKRQLKIRFNPKVSSFQNVLQEAKVETIGNKHPFIIRNGNVNYKSFPISGLLSYQMDNAKLFLSKEELGPVSNSMDLTSDNIHNERFFKLKVLDWLTNGEPKLFRSPTEGNYIVRLMNVNLTPIDGVGRMLHNFNTNAVEIADYNHKNLETYNLIDLNEHVDLQTRWSTVNLQEVALPTPEEQESSLKKTGKPKEWVTVLDRPFYAIDVKDMAPGTVIQVTQDDGEKFSIQIGATGAYNVRSELPFKKMEIYVKSILQGLVTYEFKTKASNVFNLITSTDIKDIPCYQHIGSLRDNEGELKNIFEELEDVKRKLLNITFIRFKKREIHDAFFPKDLSEKTILSDNMERALFYDRDCTEPIENFDSWVLYHLREGRSQYNFSKGPEDRPIIDEDYIVDRTDPYFAPYTDYYFDPNNGVTQKLEGNLFDVIIDGEEFDLRESEEYTLTTFGKERPVIYVNDGLIYEISGSCQILTYNIESDKDLMGLKQNYDKEVRAYHENWSQPGPDNNLKVKKTYKDFINALEKKLNKYKEDNGVS